MFRCLFASQLPLLLLVVVYVIMTNEAYGAGIPTESVDHVELNGAGSSFAMEVYKAWLAEFKTLRSRFITLDMSYDSIGSAEGKDWMENPKDYKHTIEYVTVSGKDAVMSERDYQRFPDLQMFPTVAGAVVLGYNVPGVRDLNMTRSIIVGIYNGTYVYWDDPPIRAVNPHARLPHKQILPIARQDASGTTEIFTAALSSFSPAWGDLYGSFTEGVDDDLVPYYWNTSHVNMFGKTHIGVAGMILSTDYTVGYMSVANAIETLVPYVNIYNRRGNIVHPEKENIQDAMDTAAFDDNFYKNIIDTDGAHAYPLCAYNYMIIRLELMRNCDSAVEVYRYIDWFLYDQSAQDHAETSGFVPVSTRVAGLIHKTILSDFKCRNQSVADLVRAQINKEELSLQTWRIPVYISVTIAVLIFVGVGIYVGYLLYKVNRALFRDEWKVPVEDIDLDARGKSLPSGWSLDTGSKDMASSHSSDSNVENDQSRSAFTSRCTVDSKMFNLLTVGKFRDDLVVLRETKISTWAKLKWQTRKDFLWMRDDVNHFNVSKLYGFTANENSLWFISEYCAKGLLHDILQNDKYNLDINFKFSMSVDVASGMSYLHRMGIAHGNLSSSSCFIDSKWAVKISDWGYVRLAQLHKNSDLWQRPLLVEKSLINDEDIIARNAMWMAPEILKGVEPIPTKTCDVYSFGILLVEIFSREDPYVELLADKSPSVILQDIKLRGIRPKLTENFPTNLQFVIAKCWDWMPDQRPTFSSLHRDLQKMKPSKKEVVDCMMEAVELYAAHLEERVEERTAELNATMKEFETLLHKMLPPSIATKLSKGEKVEPENFECVTIFFSDIVGFTTLASESKPIEVVTFLNDLYTAFDAVVHRHDCYKVETIGDAYMVISGLPTRNGNSHAGNIATMALELAITVGSFKIHHRPKLPLQLRVGIHTGSVCAGVVGLTMPRYCLFGDTVNTASRMESTSVARKIQVSQYTQTLLVYQGDYDLKLRGEISVKGKGSMKTYWLHGKYGLQGVPPDFRRDVE